MSETTEHLAASPRLSGARRPRRRLARSTAVFSLATAVSRVLGLVREMVSAYFFGVSGLINAFTVAIQIPNLVRALVADAALSGAFVPVFSELLERGEKQRAWRVASTLFWLTLLVLGGVTALFILLAPLLMRPFGDPGGDFDLAVGLSRVLFPIVVLLGLSGIVVGILNTYHHFALPALAPVAWNLVIILGLVLGVPQIDDESAQLYLYAGVVVLGTLVQLLLPIPWLRRLDGTADDGHRLARPGGQARPRADAPGDADDRPRERELPRRHAVRVAAARPRARAGRDRQGVPAVHAPAGDLRGRGHDGALPDARAARRPRATRPGSAARSTAGSARSRSCSCRPGFVSIVLAEPIVRLVYQRGEFTADDTVIVAQCLQAFSIGLVFNGWMLILNRSFYAMQTNWVPTGIALGAVALNAALDTVFYRLGIWGIPLATSTVNVFACGRAARDDAPAPRARARRADARASSRASLVAAAVAAGLAFLVVVRRSTRCSARPSARRSSRSAAGSRSAVSRTSGWPGRSGFASSRRCYCCEPGATSRSSRTRAEPAGANSDCARSLKASASRPPCRWWH